MKIRSFIIIALSTLLCCLIYLLVYSKRENDILKKEYSEVQDMVKQNEIDKENYISKEKELEELKMKNKDKVLKYEKVEKWNQEIKGYLD